MSKFVLLSHTLPPSPSGQAVALYRILSDMNPDDYCLVSQTPVEPAKEIDDIRFELRAARYSLPSEPAIKGTRRFGLWRIWKLMNMIILILVRTRNLLNILRKESAKAMIVCTGDLFNLPTGFLASRRAKIPFYIYVFDDFVFQWTGSERWLARLISPVVFRWAAGVIAPNEFICEEYRRRYGIDVILIRNPCDSGQLDRTPNYRWPFEAGKIKIFYTGAVYYANYGCFRNMIEALNSLQEYPLELHIFTAQTPEELDDQGIRGDKLCVHSHVPYNEILEEQRNADLLFLPLAFDSPIPQVIRTSAPGKLGEYLASGRPILAHVPPDSFVAYYMDKHQCGLVASTDSPASLQDHILRLIRFQDLQRTITDNARQRAQIDFDPRLARERFIDFVSKGPEN